jgi:hypothetical protein
MHQQLVIAVLRWIKGDMQNFFPPLAAKWKVTLHMHARTGGRLW